MDLPFKTIKEAKELKGKSVILRLDINEPVEHGAILNDFRIRKSIPTLRFLKERGAKIIILAHRDPGTASLKPILHQLNRYERVGFAPGLNGGVIKSATGHLQCGGAIMLENVRFNPGEEKNSPAFAKELASLADIYVNDAFSESHREYASVVGLPKLLPSYAGLLFAEEYEQLSRARKPKKPLCFVLGGAKFDTKLPLVKYYLPLAKTVFIGGGPANMLFKTKGYEIGRSVVGKPLPGLRALLANKKLKLPTDAVLLSGKICRTDELTKRDKIVDIGPATLEELKKCMVGAKSILFNGPLGIYNEGYGWGTEEFLKLLARSKADTVIGGGDTLALVTKLKLENKFSFVSTAGGAMLAFLAKGTLPGIEALAKSR